MWQPRPQSQHQFCLYHLLNTQNKTKTKSKTDTVKAMPKPDRCYSELELFARVWPCTFAYYRYVIVIVVIIVVASSPKIKQNSNAIIKLSACAYVCVSARDSCEFRASLLLLLLLLLSIGFVCLGFA